MMQGPFDLSTALANFDGSAPLFPLPGTVLFPHILLPLHIFEPRYRQMVSDALDGPRFIAMALPDSSLPVSSEPIPIHSTVCLGRITSDERLEDGRYAIMLQGLTRARVLHELDQPDRLYRAAELELMLDQPGGGAEVEDDLLRHEILLRYRKAFPHVDVNKVFEQLLFSDIPLSVFCDVVAYSLQQDAELTQLILDRVDVGDRARLLLEQIGAHLKVPRRAATSERDFPPPFSMN